MSRPARTEGDHECVRAELSSLAHEPADLLTARPVKKWVTMTALCELFVMVVAAWVSRTLSLCMQSRPSTRLMPMSRRQTLFIKYVI